METKIYKNFIQGLKDCGLTYNDDFKLKWKYCGGNSKEHLRYFKLSCPNDELPEPTNECICGHTITKNCYITNGDNIIILGSCCIKKFIPNKKRTCETCGNFHQNHSINKCNNCRVGICEICETECDYKYRKCYRCKFRY